MGHINVPTSESFDGSFQWPQPQFEALYNNAMDASFAALGRTITLHLTPIKVPASGIQQSTKPQLQYNPHLGRAPRPAPFRVSTTQRPAVQHTTRSVDYTAHIKHGPKASELEPVGIELDVNQIATTTVIESLAHINEAESATIDGRRCQLHSAPRQIGLQSKRYVITVWQIITETEAP